ncbi:MAG TPA: winged helix-turn-helix domain-containing protein, partial [Solirubrobacteraceae bacterium]|nr:winged helix-turn-helix domain-containing protein [Solirubrobacteraceae bacterium]
MNAEDLRLAIDRDAEVAIGVQLAWALRARIEDGSARAGERLPGLREVADATGLNINTVRAVYQRLDGEGLIDSRQGSGTFVSAAARGPASARA